eukprot:1846730-Rhodomonas_salina.1
MDNRRPRLLPLPAPIAFKIYGFSPKSTIDWNTVLCTPSIDMTKLVLAGLAVPDLQKLQPRLSEWVNSKKASLHNIAQLSGWALNIPSESPDITLIDCIQLAGLCDPQRMLEFGLTLDRLQSVY